MTQAIEASPTGPEKNDVPSHSRPQEIAQAATVHVSEAIRATKQELQQEAEPEGIAAASDTASSAWNANEGVLSSVGSTIGKKEGEVLTARETGASPRPVKPGTDLRASFLAAVGNTIPLTVSKTKQMEMDCVSFRGSKTHACGGGTPSGDQWPP